VPPKPKSDSPNRTLEEWIKLITGILVLAGTICGAVFWLASLRADVSTLTSNFSKLEKHQDDTDKKIDQRQAAASLVAAPRQGKILLGLRRSFPD
jgi:hypothetical protein